MPAPETTLAGNTVVLGQGIAGSVLALELNARNIPFVVVDNAHRTASSQVAAGLWNPVVYRKLNYSWNAQQVVPHLYRFYRAAEMLLGARFFHPGTLHKFYKGSGEEAMWQEQAQVNPFISATENTDIALHPRLKLKRHGRVKHGGYLDVPLFLSRVKLWLRETDRFCEHDYREPTPAEATNPNWNLPTGIGNRPHLLISAVGSQAARSPWWGYLGFGITHGDVLTIYAPELHLRHIVNAGFFILPLGNDLYRVGATFNWNVKHTQPTAEGRHELETKLRTLLNVPFSVVDHRAGLRPTVQDRRALLGRHPEISDWAIFNGLGTKGVMLAPWLSAHLCNHLYLGQPLHPEVDIKRFHHLYSAVNR